MADVLSQSEVESLLAALDPGAKPAAAAPAQAAKSADSAAPISIYDFKRPERVSKEQMRSLHALHEGFSREFGAGLSGMLRTIVECKLISVDQLTYSEFVFSLENPTCFNLLESEQFEGNIILDLNPSIIYPIVDRLLGGGRESGQSYPNRGLTEIELRLVTRITDLAIAGLEAAWINICEWKLRVRQVESNPQLVQIVPPNEVIVLISFEITMGEMRGIMNLCIPFNTIEPLSSKLSSDAWSAYSKKAADPRQRLNLEAGLNQAKVEMVVHLANSVVTTSDLKRMAIGDIIMTDKGIEQGMQILIEGRPTFRGSPGVIKGHKAVQIGEALVRPEDIVEKKLAETAGKSGSAGVKKKPVKQ